MKFLKWAGIIVGGLIVILFIAFQVLKANTKKHSPEDTVVLEQGDLTLTVYYNQPSKKGRDIFGDLIPYGEVWRTGANEATTFETTKDLTIGGKKLPAGKYTLWTIPGETEWSVIFNKEMYGWGVSFDGKASRKPEADALEVKVPVEMQSSPTEMFTITLEGAGGVDMILAWDDVKVRVPIQQG